ncbi:MAG: hypothetical protein B0W54_20715 [Cellvibrio sp. 79]|nr:MAG: hypothetical protein B0W54_20715 [Cellvibrio sp. 79]
MHDSRVDEPLLWYPNGNVTATNRHNLLSDHQGSIVAVTDNLANVTAINTYDAYGSPGNNNQGRFSYTGQPYLPEIGLYYYKARMYSPTLGRFLQTDPINKNDPTGMFGYYPGHNELSAEFSGQVLAAASTIADFTPVVGDVKAIGEAMANPSAINVAAAAVGIVPGIGDAASKTIKAESAVSAVKLEKQLASEAQVGQLAKDGGTVISQPANQAERIAAHTAADAGNIQKVSSDAYTARGGQQVQTHSFRDASINELIEPKTIIDEQSDSKNTEDNMTKVERISSKSGNRFIDVMEHEDGSYLLHQFIRKYDLEKRRIMKFGSFPILLVDLGIFLRLF